MKEVNITQIKVDPENPPSGETDWEWIKNMTEEEIHAAASDDPDAQPLTEEELSQFRRVVDVASIRKRLQLSQREFAKTYHISLRTLQEWEQKRIRPDITARAFLKAIANDPQGVKRALEKGEARP
jgi:putative transcriptional regulator